MKEDRDEDGGGVVKVASATVPSLVASTGVQTAVDVDSCGAVILTAGLEIRPDFECERGHQRLKLRGREVRQELGEASERGQGHGGAVTVLQSSHQGRERGSGLRVLHVGGEAGGPGQRQPPDQGEAVRTADEQGGVEEREQGLVPPGPMLRRC